jgi:hypothetical protein
MSIPDGGNVVLCLKIIIYHYDANSMLGSNSLLERLFHHQEIAVGMGGRKVIK